MEARAVDDVFKDFWDRRADLTKTFILFHWVFLIPEIIKFTPFFRRRRRDRVRTSPKLKEIMKKILYLGNTLNQGTARGAAVGFKLDSLSKLSDIHAANRKMTLMHYLCKGSDLLDFPKDIESLEKYSSKIQLKSLAEEMQAIIKGLEKLINQ
ncbi:hypothetical protein Rs2_11557 [Raphanus sativus]|nr:hypothetical protein Rs2_11557 [Raphanus sativus]